MRQKTHKVLLLLPLVSHCLVGQGPEPAAKLPPGTTIAIRTIDPIDSKTAELGQNFRASLDQPLVVAGRQLAAKGADATIRIVEQKSAGKVSGNAALAVMLVSIASGGTVIPVESDNATVEGKGKGKRSAFKIGGGAALGAAVGAAVGGGKGAAVGAGAGAGAGTVAALISGAHVRIPAETLLNFTVQK